MLALGLEMIQYILRKTLCEATYWELEETEGKAQTSPDLGSVLRGLTSMEEGAKGMHSDHNDGMCCMLYWHGLI